MRSRRAIPPPSASVSTSRSTVSLHTWIFTSARPSGDGGYRQRGEDLHFFGGEYGIITKRTSPVWQFLLMDSSFEGQREAAIHTMEVGFTLVRVRFAPPADGDSNRSDEVEQLYGRDLQMEDVRTAALKIGRPRNPHSEVTLTNVACSGVPVFYQGEERRSTSPRRRALHGRSLHARPGNRRRRPRARNRHAASGTCAIAARPGRAARDIPALPPMSQWVNVRTLDVKGDGRTDDTAALLAAIEKHQRSTFPAEPIACRARSSSSRIRLSSD